MARPKKQTVDYFPHFAHASNGKTLFILESKFGNDGYAFWFKLLELLASTEGHVYDCRNSTNWEFLLAKTHLNEDIANEILKTLVDLGAIDGELYSEKVIWSQNLVENVSDVYKNRKVDLPQKPSFYNQKPEQAAVSTTENYSDAVVSTDQKPQSKVKYSKVKQSKVNNNIPLTKLSYGEFKNILLTDEEYQKLINRFGQGKTEELIERLSQGIESKGYKYKSHYATILNWERNYANKSPPLKGLKSTWQAPKEYQSPEEFDAQYRGKHTN